MHHDYGLAALIYTHFTSPILRNAGVVKYPLLAANIGPEALTEYAHDRCV